MKGNFRTGVLLAAIAAATPTFAADSILDGPAPGPCAAAMAGADYVPGADAAGQPVPRADIGAEHTAIPDQLFVALPNRSGRGGRGDTPPGQGPVAAIDGKRLDGLVNPQPCAAPPPPPAGR